MTYRHFLLIIMTKHISGSRLESETKEMNQNLVLLSKLFFPYFLQRFPRQVSSFLFSMDWKMSAKETTSKTFLFCLKFWIKLQIPFFAFLLSSSVGIFF